MNKVSFWPDVLDSSPAFFPRLPQAHIVPLIMELFSCLAYLSFFSAYCIFLFRSRPRRSWNSYLVQILAAYFLSVFLCRSSLIWSWNIILVQIILAYFFCSDRTPAILKQSFFILSQLIFCLYFCSCFISLFFAYIAFRYGPSWSCYSIYVQIILAFFLFVFLFMF
jgi:hypothetical protein